MTELIEHLKAEVLPTLFRDPTTIATYGRLGQMPGVLDQPGPGGQPAAPVDASTQLHALMEAAPVNRLAHQLAALVASLSDADPKKIAVQPNWLARITGRHVETYVRYQVARKNLDDVLVEAEVAAQGVRDTVGAIDRLMKGHEAEVAQLEAYIKAGQEYLTDNPTAGQPAAGGIEFDNPRERFARKLANLATLLSSHGMSHTQMKLIKAQAVDMLDRFEQTTQVLIPVWRQHSMQLSTSKTMSAEQVAEATQAHARLMQSLQQNIAGLRR